jgi:hypothetical protein
MNMIKYLIESETTFLQSVYWNPPGLATTPMPLLLHPEKGDPFDDDVEIYAVFEGNTF